MASRFLTARRPNHLWHVDLTTVPTALGLWTSWVPFALPQVWPFCRWMSLAIDHCSRRVMGFAAFRRQPSAEAVRRFLGRLFWVVGHQPRHLVTDQGRQFIVREFTRWCRRRGIQQRFGAIGKYGSLAVIERCIRMLKTECTGRLTMVPYRLAALQRELALYFSWYNGHRPHARLGADRDADDRRPETDVSRDQWIGESYRMPGRSNFRPEGDSSESLAFITVELDRDLLPVPTGNLDDLILLL